MKQTKQIVGYRPGNKYNRCQLCKWFRSPHACEKVEGKILHTDLCDLYSQSRSPFDYSPDEGETPREDSGHA